MKNHFKLNQRYNNKIIYIFLFIIILFICFNTLIFDSSIKIFLNILLIIFIQTFIFIIFGMDIISGISILSIWILIPSILVKYTNYTSYGDIALGFVPIYIYEDTLYICLFLIIWSFLSYIFKINLLEQHFSFQKLKLNNLTIQINNIIAIVFSFITFPTIHAFGSIAVDENRFQMLLPGHAWNQLVIVALLFNLPYIIKKKSVIFTYFISIYWFLIHGERADMAGLFFGMLILIFMSKNISKNKKLISLIISLFIPLILISVGSARSIGHFPNLIESANNLFNFSTVSDVSYAFNVTIDYIKNFPLNHGKIFISTLESSIPFIPGSYYVGNILSSLYPYPGGSFILSDQLMDGGVLGIFIYTFIYTYLIRYVLFKSKSSLLFRYEILVLICSLPRIAWYGLTFTFTSIIFFVPFMYLLDIYVNNYD